MNTGVDIRSLWVLLWVVTVNDYVIKFGTIVLKVLVLSLPSQLSHFRRRVSPSSHFSCSHVDGQKFMTVVVTCFRGDFTFSLSTRPSCIEVL